MAIAPAIDITADQRRTVLSLLRRHLPNTTVWAYGSRVKWTSQPTSDLDLVAFADPEQSLRIAELREEFDESNLPFIVDLFLWHDVPKDFRKRIEAEHVVLARKERSPGRDWLRTTLGDCALLVADKVDPADCGDLPYIGLEHIGKGTLTLLGTGRARDVQSTKSAFRTGDILFGKLRPYFRKVVRPDFDGICSTDIWAVRPKAGVDAGYLFYLIASKAFMDYASQGSEGTRMPRAKWKHVARYAVHHPPMAEQRAIAHVLGALDDKIELNRRMAETLDALVRSLFGELCDLDHNWPHRSLADIAQLVRGRSYTSKELEHSAETAMVTLKSFERGGGYRPGGLKAFRGPYKVEQAVSPGEVVVACTDVTQAAEVVGRSAIVQQTRRFKTLVASLDVLVLRPAERDVSTAFLYALTRAPRFVAHAKAHATGTTVLHLDRKAVPRFSFRYPPKERLNTFNDIAQPAIERYSKLMCEADCIKEVRDALLPQLLSGRLRVHGAEKLAEAVT